MKPCLIFDLDGTLVDSLPGIAASLNRTLTAHGLPGHSDARVRSFIGDGIRNLILRAIPKGAEPATVESLFWKSGSTIYPGVANLLDELQKSGFEMAVLSNKVHDFTVEMVREMFPAIRFAAVLGQRDGIPHKPNPAGALQLADMLGAAPENCVVIGDSTMDLETAANAGMRAIAVTWGYHDRERLLAAGASRLIDHPSALPALLE
ncbi:MAG: HAD family hydrolase [Akkermansiaceae bacterium]|nr:HAD family hydrolase [Akkermansiaceae bacterium]